MVDSQCCRTAAVSWGTKEAGCPTCDSRTNMRSSQVNLQIHSPSSEHGAHTRLWLPSFLRLPRGCKQLITAATRGPPLPQGSSRRRDLNGGGCDGCVTASPWLPTVAVEGLIARNLFKSRVWRREFSGASSFCSAGYLNFFFTLDVRKEIKSSILKIHFQVVNQMSTETTLCRQFFGAWNDPNRPSIAKTKEPPSHTSWFRFRFRFRIPY